MDDYIKYWQLWHHNWDGEDLAVIQRLGDLEGKDVLEIGCGDGRLTFALAAGCSRIIGADYEQRFVDIAAERVADKALSNVSFEHMDAQSLEFQDASFDVVLMPWVLQMVDDPVLAVSEARRVLRAGGKLIIVALESNSDYDKLIALFAGQYHIDNTKVYQNPLRQAFGYYETVETGYPFKYFFDSLEIALDSFRFAFKRWYQHDLLDSEMETLKEAVAKFTESDGRIAITFPGSVYLAINI